MLLFFKINCTSFVADYAATSLYVSVFKIEFLGFWFINENKGFGVESIFYICDANPLYLMLSTRYFSVGRKRYSKTQVDLSRQQI